jgi:hypothetical protein
LKKKKIVLPVLAAIALVVVLWLAFHDRSVASVRAEAVSASAKAS